MATSHSFCGHIQGPGPSFESVGFSVGDIVDSNDTHLYVFAGHAFSTCRL